MKQRQLAMGGIQSASLGTIPRLSCLGTTHMSRSPSPLRTCAMWWVSFHICCYSQASVAQSLAKPRSAGRATLDTSLSAASFGVLQHVTTEGACEDSTVLLLPVALKLVQLVDASCPQHKSYASALFGLALTQTTAFCWW